MPFLTLEDPNAKIKGSRDPLGAQPLWAAFGRHVVTNLTTQSTSVRGFTILLLGRYLAADLAERGLATREDALDIFLRTEQIGAYVRYVGHGVEGDTRGIERVKTFLDERRGRVVIQPNRQGMILSDQKTYGLWGLYSVPARVSGLIPDGPYGVLSSSRKLISEEYLETLGTAERSIQRLLSKGGWLDTRARDGVFQAFADVLKPKLTTAEHEFYGSLLRDGIEVEHAPAGRQARFRELLERHTDLNEPTGRAEVMALAKAARKLDEGLASSLDRITHLEALLAPADALFQYVLTQNDQSRSDVAKRVRQHWGKRVPNCDRAAFAELIPEIRERSTKGVATEMDRCHDALRQGDYAEAVDSLIEWNRQVMNARGGAPWARRVTKDKLEVRYRGVEQTLPDKDDLPELWSNSYFIDSLKTVARQLST